MMRRCFESRRGRERSRSPPLGGREAVDRSSSPIVDLTEGGSSSSRSRQFGSDAALPELHVLYASPLDRRLPQMNIQGELELLTEALKQSKCSMPFHVSIATTKAFVQLLTLARTSGNVILHLSVHVVTDGTGLVFETAFGGPHILQRQQLEELFSGKAMDGLLLVFLNGCFSESIAQLLIEAGCQVVVATRGRVLDMAAATFTQQFYYCLGSQESVRSAFESAQQMLRVDPNPKVKASADMFVLFGQHNSRVRTLGSRGQGDATPPPISRSHSSLESLESASSFMGENVASLETSDAFPLPSRAEDFMDRSSLLCDILRHFDTSSSGGNVPRRACIVTGKAGIGKSALAIELAHFASAPGRLFSRNVSFVQLQKAQTDTMAVLRRFIEALRPIIGSPIPEEVADGETVGRLSFFLQRSFSSLDLRRGRHLLIVDDHTGLVRKKVSIRNLLSGILENTKKLCIIICSREQIYESLAGCKCINIEVPGLTNLDSAHLFLRRVHRPLRACDLVAGTSDAQVLERSDAMLAQLASHPLIGKLAGNPGCLRAAAQLVTPSLRSLFDLSPGTIAGLEANVNRLGCAVSPKKNSNTAGVDGVAVGSDNVAARGSGDGDGAARSGGENRLFRAMSVDESQQASGSLSRTMSVDTTCSDGPSLGRLMSVDDTQSKDPDL
eukprot:TRINITY_DN79031_c0_g1_i1.p1 TRINITY_DN79031_c0_g1~~TRINITY_DN79031_c0_g1_i1.p1  ORF type:complete len:671 (+),score=100.27 TRINITY_DN79031_c0_g1_i1:40-2052(+)